jgi:nucleotide-binding universal stress UspA family protein
MNFQKILSPIQFDDSNSVAALDLARRWSLGSKASIFLLHVIPSTPVLPARPGHRDRISTDEDAVRRELEKLAATHLRDAHYQIVVRAGDPAKMISLVARELGADMIIMSTHDHPALSHPSIGSIVERVEWEASCIVLTVYPRGLLGCRCDGRPPQSRS